MAYKSQERIGRTLWTSYAAVAWCVVFGALHFYWALGGTIGFLEFSIPSNRLLVLTRAPVYVGLTWAVGILCVFAAIAALAPIQPWSRRIPRWLLLTPLWMGCGLLLVRGIGNPIQTALVASGVVTFAPLSGPDAQAWYEWLRLDLLFFSPWFILGGLAFGATAWLARRHGDDMVSEEQRYRLS
jgi:hypothetical protein